MTSSAPLDRLLAIMARLRDPNGGCPWDLEQDFASIAPYTIEEAYEVADAITQGDMAALRDELGDLLFQVVFHARMAEEQGAFAFADVARAIAEKMERRHPHVFGEAEVRTAADQTVAWEATKAAERAASGTNPSVLDGVPVALPGLTRAVKLQKRAARVGFDWGDPGPVLDKLAEEALELKAELDAGAPKAQIEGEFGDILFVLANLARHLDIDPESAVRATNAKFERRFRQIEAWLQESGKTPEQSTLAEMDELWDRAKGLEKASE